MSATAWLDARGTGGTAGYPHGVPTVLVVDDEEVVRDVVGRYLRRDGYDVVEAADGEAARQRFEDAPPDLVILDVMLPILNGLALCEWIRERSEVPVILLTARDEETDRIVGLEIGADDYVTKPFSPRELAARVKVILRRVPPKAAVPSEVAGGGISIDSTTREVRRAGEAVDLTSLEFDLLWFLATHPREVFSRAQLLGAVWGHSSALELGTSTVTVHVRRLREKIEEDPSRPAIVQTVWGVGYRFVP